MEVAALSSVAQHQQTWLQWQWAQMGKYFSY
jgi:hypothetical protein